MKKTIPVLLLLLFILPLSDPALAGRNAGGKACLTWTLNTRDYFLCYWDVEGVVDLYLRLEGITEVVGVEFAMSWGKDWGSPSMGCLELIDVQAPVGTDCTFLTRGRGIFGLRDIGETYVEAAYAGSEWTSECTSGQTARMPFVFNLCGSDPCGWFCLEHCKVTDHSGVIDHMAIIGGNPAWSCAYIGICIGRIEGATWGAIKAMYK